MPLPPLAVQSFAVLASVKPWPLQAFCPLQALLALLQALWPLQALAPPHFTGSAAKAAVAKVVAAKIEAAVAINVRLSMSPPGQCERRARIRAIRTALAERYAAEDLTFLCGCDCSRPVMFRRPGPNNKSPLTLSSSKDLSALMRLARGGDDEAYRQLLGHVAMWLRGVARRGLVRAGRGVEDGEDIVQETLLAMH